MCAHVMMCTGAGASGEQVHTLRELLPLLGFSVVKMVLLAIMTYVLTTYTQLPMFPKYLAWCECLPHS